MGNSTDQRYSYEAARSEEGATSAEEVTLAGDEDLPLFPEELAFSDPLDEKDQARLDFKILHKKQSSLRKTLQEWVARPHRYLGLTSQPREAASTEADLGLLQTDEAGEAAPILKWSAAAEQTVSWLVWLLPSFTHHFFINVSDKEVHRSTDYLDGMRGVASLFVFFDHYMSGLYDSLRMYGFGDQDHWSILQLPFIKIFYSGAAMVAIFFVISGYVLSQRCILAMRAGKHDKLYSALTSMAFRRAMRLFLPSLMSSFITFLVSIAGFLPPPNPHWTLLGEFHRYWKYLMEDLFKVWSWNVSFKGWYGSQLWTISFEYKCSMFLFVFILMVARCKVAVRLGLEAIALLYLFYRDRWDIATFLGGMFIAEINTIYDERKIAHENLDYEPEVKLKRNLCKRILRASPLWILFMVGLYLAGYPMVDAPNTPGYDVLSKFWEADWDYKRRFWLAIAALMMVFATSFVKHLQWLFSTPIARYLGKISYALYLVHGLLNRTVRLWLWATFWNILQYETEDGDDIKFDGGWIIGTVIYLPIVFWCADIFWRIADIPSVNFAKWVESKCFKAEQKVVNLGQRDV